MPVVEVVPHPETAPEVVGLTKEFYRLLDRYPVVLQKEVPGFIANRLQCIVWIEALALVHREVVTPEELGKELHSMKHYRGLNFDIKPDILMSQGLGLRWALTGQFMTAILGGGGNPGGFERVMNHIGPGLWAWMKDIQANTIVTGEPMRALPSMIALVQNTMEIVDTMTLERERDELLIEILRLKKEKKNLM